MPTQSPALTHSGPAFAFWLMLSILTIVTTFGVGTAINMIFRRWWLSLVLFVVFAVYLVVRVGGRMIWPEWMLFVIGLVGVVLSSISVRALKKNGYPLFS